MRLIDADELMEHVGRDRLDSRELIMQMIDNARTIDMSKMFGGPLSESPKYQRTVTFFGNDIQRAKEYDEPLVFTSKNTALDILWLLEEYGRREIALEKGDT